MNELNLALIPEINDHLQDGTFQKWAEKLPSEKLMKVVEVFNFVMNSQASMDAMETEWQAQEEGELDLTEANKEIARIQRISFTGPLK